MKKLVHLTMGALLALTLSGCATLFGSSNRTIHVTSQPSGAEVFLNGQPVGVTPVNLEVASPVSSNYIMLSKTGYQTTTLPVQTSFQKIGILNVLFWPGFIVDALTGDMMTIENPSISVPLQVSSAS